MFFIAIIIFILNAIRTSYYRYKLTLGHTAGKFSRKEQNYFRKLETRKNSQTKLYTSYKIVQIIFNEFINIG